ncbi:glycosyltransferase [Sorangium sp. So ce1667]
MDNIEAPRAPLTCASQSASRRGLLLIGVYATLAAAYLVWRATTLNPDAKWISIALFAVEVSAITASVAQMCLFRFRASKREIPFSLPKDASVAVIIPVHREPIGVVLPTISAALRIEYPHETWVLDDGRDPALEKLCRTLGVNYLVRDDRRHYKAGNINHFLERTTCEFILCLDADGIAHPKILHKTLGYFADPEVAFVQPPLEIYNERSFEHDPGEVVRGEVWYENIILHKVMQPALGAHGSALWTGSGGLLRVSALRSIGGVAIESFNDDVTTTYKLFEKRWRSAYHPQALVKALCPYTPRDYLAQRNRWSRGGAQMHRIFNPLTARNMNWVKRLALFLSFDYWLFQPFRFLFFMLLPGVVALLETPPILANPGLFALTFVALFISRQASFSVNFGGYVGGALNLVLAYAALQHRLAATWTYVTGNRKNFVTTAKGKAAASAASSRVERTDEIPFLLWPLALVNAAAIAKLVFLAVTGSMSAWQLGWIAVGIFFAWQHLVIISKAIGRIRDPQYRPERRAAWRFALPVTASLDGEQVPIEDVSVSGVRLRSQRPLDRSGPVRLTFEIDHEPLTLSGTFARSQGDTWCLQWQAGQELELSRVCAAYGMRLWP